MNPTAPVMMKDYGTFAAVRSVTLPRGWLIPKNSADSARFAAAIERLRWHGVQIREVGADAQLAVERFSITDMTKAPKAFQGHQEARLKGTFDRAQLTVQAGSLYIPASQPLARLNVKSRLSLVSCPSDSCAEFLRLTPDCGEPSFWMR